MDDWMRISDADRDRAAARLREDFAAGRLSAEELDERLSAVFSAKTHGDLRRVTADLPDPALATAGPWPPGAWAAHRGRRGLARRGPGLLPLALLALAAVLLLPGVGWLLFVLVNLILAVALVGFVSLVVAGAVFHHRLHRHWRSGTYWRYYQWHGPARW